ncbi:CYFA0S13e00408g1_1 [Cyberlindnera fabianii]|uniref:CYFA0S13e00408g1_1 n=1 Tax=Cyberlindnera fabianii TaxID=36022 RepID=A0A061B7P3_CYBFA|nr:CYFA0S13e00408g1_1 [Cyberlindnera fabianii]
MPSFADSFWTPDYQTGLEVLFSKLHQGCTENEEFISLFTDRMQSELDYGHRLALLPTNHPPSKSGFDKDEGASLKNSFKGISHEMSVEGETHLNIGHNIKTMVVDPFSKWSEEHRQRVEYSEEVLTSSFEVYKNKLKYVEKVQKKYFNKCRTLESMKQGLSEEELLKEMSIEDDDKDPDQETLVTLGGFNFTKSKLQELLQRMLTEIPQRQIKLAILGTYDHCCTGSQIGSWLQKKLKVVDLDQCETFGQDLIMNGYLRKLSTMGAATGGSFVNSGSFDYQWKELAYHAANIPLRKDMDGSLVEGDYNSNDGKVSGYLDDLKSSWEKPTLKKVDKQLKALDSMYQNEVKRLDKIRCDLEELIVDHLSFMEKCELDRMRALKKVILDFAASISNNITSIKATIDKILVYEETISPDKDLLFLLQNYRTGPFSPNVVLYDNYYDSFRDQIFGVGLESRCKRDNKTVPVIVSSILSYMDSIYPDLASDEVRTKSWLISVRLQSTHALRSQIEQVGINGLIPEFWSKFPPEVITSVLKLYLLELPDSLVPSSVYELIKTIYNNYGTKEQTEDRIKGITNILKDLDRPNIATLNAICTHFQRLITILDENRDNGSSLAQSFQDGIAQEFSHCVLRPKIHTNLTLSDKHTFRFLHDLLGHKTEIFKNVKRAGSVNNANGSHKFGHSSVKRQDSTLQTRLKQAVEKGEKKAHLGDVEEGDGEDEHEQEKSLPEVKE